MTAKCFRWTSKASRPLGPVSAVTLANYVTTAAIVFVAVVFVVGGFLVVTGLWARTVATLVDLWHSRRPR